jgi:hypothetical protein
MLAVCLETDIGNQRVCVVHGTLTLGGSSGIGVGCPCWQKPRFLPAAKRSCLRLVRENSRRRFSPIEKEKGRAF